MDIEILKKAVEQAWAEDTCYPGSLDQWSRENPSVGQSAITALVVQDYFGGEILHCDLYNHDWNLVPGMGELDLARECFPEGTEVCVEEKRTREILLTSPKTVAAGTPGRYALFKSRVQDLVAKMEEMEI